MLKDTIGPAENAEKVKIWHNDNPFQKYAIIYISNKAWRNEWYMN